MRDNSYNDDDNNNNNNKNKLIVDKNICKIIQVKIS